MPWSSLTSDDVDEVLSSKEKGVVSTEHLGNTSIADTIALVVARVRGDVGRCSPLDTDTTKIPDSLKLSALVLVRHHLVSRLAGSEMLLTEIRMQEYHDATQHFKDVRLCRVAIEAPDNPIVSDTEAFESSSGGSELQDFCV